MNRTKLIVIAGGLLVLIVGMLPIAVSVNEGAEWRSGLAWALIGGLASSLLLTLVLVPVVYVKVDQWRETVPAFVRRLIRKMAGKETEERVPDVVPAMNMEKASK